MPSKVLHLRNLPWECIEDGLVELCRAFGKIVNSRSNVGANHNQAFAELIAVYAEIGTMRNRVVGDRGCVNCYDHCAL
ncbi:hypothetical protein RHSIM_Rhsim05G0209200 [Rhododendron simsii]|uniref:RRM domain-containing protein n=1 Tax=Rhododendron simsii TaxID=118357 RepID=A0A834H2V7_RHOSS|nr:hypothetical protein RHSIM_Rhsim05G0209200 [Rhododendron simsii]